MKHRRKQNGMALSTVLILLGLVALTLMTLANLSIAAVRMTINGRDKTVSLCLAEAGVDDVVDKIGRDPDGYTTAPRAEETTTLTDGAATNPETLGTFAVRTVPVDENQVDVFATGTAAGTGARREVRARVNVSGLTLGDGAMLSNGPIRINGSVVVQTFPANRRNAHVRANGNIDGIGSAYVDGRLAAAGTVSLGSNVTTTDTLFPSGQSGAARIAFPTTVQIAQWTAQWTAGAQAGGTLNGTINQTTTIVGPKYINGDITLGGGDTLTIQGAGPIFVSGNVTMRGNSRLVNASNLIVQGKFSQAGNADGDPTYEANPDTAAAPTALISLSPDLDDAIALTGTATNNQYSIIYAVNGGIDVQGNSQVRGSLIAGGKNASITASGNYTHSYPDGSVNKNRIAVVAVVTSWIEM